MSRTASKDHATVHDFLPLLPVSSVRASDLEKRLLIAELARVAEFARLAINFTEVARELEPITSRYDLAHHLFG